MIVDNPTYKVDYLMQFEQDGVWMYLLPNIDISMIDNYHDYDIQNGTSGTVCCTIDPGLFATSH